MLYNTSYVMLYDRLYVLLGLGLYNTRCYITHDRLYNT